MASTSLRAPLAAHSSRPIPPRGTAALGPSAGGSSWSPPLCARGPPVRSAAVGNNGGSAPRPAAVGPSGGCDSPLTARAVATPLEMPPRAASSSPSDAPRRPQRRRHPLDGDVECVMLSAEEIEARVADVADRISSDLAGHDDVLVLGVLTGAFMFTSDLVRHLTISTSVRFCKASSYHGTESTGEVAVSSAYLKEEDVRGKTVLLVEDIIDTGNTLSKLVGMVQAMGPKEIRVVCLLDKPERRVVDVHVDYTAFTIPDKFVIGYGLDFNEKYRSLPYIGVLKPELYAHL